MDFAYAGSGRKKLSGQNDGRIFQYTGVQSSDKSINLHAKS